MLVYDALNVDLYKYITSDHHKILDIGCGSGALGAYIKSQINAGADVTGITYSEEEAQIANTRLNKVLVADLNIFDFSILNKFDLIICSHILEHLLDPAAVLQKLHANLSTHGKLLIALPNILYWKQRLRFIKGDFKYTKGGLMDDTHFRFFDWESAQKLLTESHYKILKAESKGNLPLPVIRKVLPKGLTEQMDQLAISLFPGLLGFQFIFLASEAK